MTSSFIKRAFIATVVAGAALGSLVAHASPADAPRTTVVLVHGAFADGSSWERVVPLTKTAISSARLYWENKLAFFDVKNLTIPVAVSVFPDEIYAAPRSWTQRAYPKLIHYNKLDKGGHFAAWEQPQLFAAELRAAFRSLR